MKHMKHIVARTVLLCVLMSFNSGLDAWDGFVWLDAEERTKAFCGQPIWCRAISPMGYYLLDSGEVYKENRVPTGFLIQLRSYTQEQWMKNLLLKTGTSAEYVWPRVLTIDGVAYQDVAVLRWQLHGHTDFTSFGRRSHKNPDGWTKLMPVPKPGGGPLGVWVTFRGLVPIG